MFFVYVMDTDQGLTGRAVERRAVKLIVLGQATGTKAQEIVFCVLLLLLLFCAQSTMKVISGRNTFYGNTINATNIYML